MTNPAAIREVRRRRDANAEKVLRDQRRLRVRWARRWKRSRVRRWLGLARQTLARWRLQAPAPTMLFLGWAAITAGVAEIGASRIVWAVSAGLLALGMYGYRTLGITLWLGLEVLKRTPRETKEDR